MHSMHRKALFMMTLLITIALCMAGCSAIVPGNVNYQPGNLSIFIHSDNAEPDAVLEVAVFHMEDLHQTEFVRVADNFPLEPGDNMYSLPVSLTPGKYRCFIYTSTKTTRYPVVIRDFDL